MSTWRRGCGRTVPASVVVLGDACVLLVFALIGRWSHHEFDIAGWWKVIGTAAPFLAGWFLVASITDAYASRQFLSYRTAAARVFMSWSPALFLSLVIRSLVMRDIPAFPFVVVALLFNALTLAAWRVSLAAWMKGT